MAAARTALVLLAVAAFLLLAPAASAQAPVNPTQPCGEARISTANPTLGFAPGEAQIVSVAAAIGGSTGVKADATLTLVLPPGWSAEPKSVTLSNIPGGKELPASFTVTAPDPMATGGRSETLSVSGKFACFSDVAGQKQKLQDMQDPSPLSITLQARAPSSVVPFASDELLLAAGAVSLVLVGAVVVWAVARKRGPQSGLRFTCAEPDKRIRPGRGVSYPLRAENLTDKPDAVRMEVVDVPEGWTAFMATTEVQLAPRETRIVWLMVRAPADGSAAGRAEIRVKAHSQVDPKQQPVVRVVASVAHEPLVTSMDDRSGVSP